MNKKVFLSIIIPVYNEESRIEKLLNVYQFLKKQRYTFEIVVVNDGSNDATEKCLVSLQKKFPFQVITYAKNKGKGYAVIQGMLAAKGAYRLFTDIDLSTPIQMTNEFVRVCRLADVTIGSRRAHGAVLVKHQPIVREFMGRVFTWLSRVITDVSVSDFTCGFKCFSARSAKAIFPKMTIWRWGFDVESLSIAKQLGYSIQEVPVTWENNPYSRVKIPQDIIRSFVDLAQIKWFLLRGKYHK